MTMSMHSAALRYLDQWFNTEEPIRRRLRGADREQQRTALKRGAAFFRISRNFGTKYERDVPRYDPVLDALGSLPRRCAGGVDEVVRDLARTLKHTYEKNVLSAASKLLWLTYRDPIVIYDSRGRRALGTRDGDYPAFRAAWEERWANSRARIIQACTDLPSALQWAACGNRVTRHEVATVVRQGWFRRRVLDIALWDEGGPEDGSEDTN